MPSLPTLPAFLSRFALARNRAARNDRLRVKAGSWTRRGCRRRPRRTISYWVIRPSACGPHRIRRPIAGYGAARARRDDQYRVAASRCSKSVTQVCDSRGSYTPGDREMKMKFVRHAAAGAALVAALAGSQGAWALDIVLTNDDGFESALTYAVYQRLNAAGHRVIISASTADQSGRGGPVDFLRPVLPLAAPSRGGCALSRGAPGVGNLALGGAFVSGRLPRLTRTCSGWPARRSRARCTASTWRRWRGGASRPTSWSPARTSATTPGWSTTARARSTRR